MVFAKRWYERPTIGSESDERMPVGTIYCVGQNYVKHIDELNSVNIGKPLIFTKPVTSIVEEGQPIVLPSYSTSIHHEVELYLYIGAEGKNIPESDVPRYIWGYGLALDLTLRDIQGEAKKNGGPWVISKGFDTSCPISRVHRMVEFDALSGFSFYLKKNGAVVQRGEVSRMIFPPSVLVSFLSRHFTLQPGDIVLTGTPEGVGPVVSNDRLEFGGDGIPEMSFTAVSG